MEKLFFILLSVASLYSAQDYGIGISVDDYASFSSPDSQQVLRHLAAGTMANFSSNFKAAHKRLKVEEQKNHVGHTFMVLLDFEIIRLVDGQETFETTVKKPALSFEDWANFQLLDKIVADGIRDNFHHKKDVYLATVFHCLRLYHQAELYDALLRQSSGADRGDNFTHVLCHLLPKDFLKEGGPLTDKTIYVLDALKRKEAAQQNRQAPMQPAKRARIDIRLLDFDCNMQ